MTWIYRFQTTRPLDGRQVVNTKVIGLVKEIGSSEMDAWLEVGRLGLDIQRNQSLGNKPTFGSSGTLSRVRTEEGIRHWSQS